MIKAFVKKSLNAAGYELQRIPRASMQDATVETSPRDEAIWQSVQPFTMTGRLRVLALVSAVRYVIAHRIPGDFVECGVWRGGSAMAIALTLREMGVFDRKIWLYDTFAGMTEPTDVDVDRFGISARERMGKESEKEGASIWCVAPREQVELNMRSTGFPSELTQFVEGDVVETLSQTCPGKISLLRLDTDWFESTLIELRVLYPRLSENGVCILDDFGCWSGARKAVLQFFSECPPAPLLNHVDSEARLIVKPSLV